MPNRRPLDSHPSSLCRLIAAHHVTGASARARTCLLGRRGTPIASRRSNQQLLSPACCHGHSRLSVIRGGGASWREHLSNERDAARKTNDRRQDDRISGTLNDGAFASSAISDRRTTLIGAATARPLPRTRGQGRRKTICRRRILPLEVGGDGRRYAEDVSSHSRQCDNT